MLAIKVEKHLCSLSMKNDSQFDEKLHRKDHFMTLQNDATKRHSEPLNSSNATRYWFKFAQLEAKLF